MALTMAAVSLVFLLPARAAESSDVAAVKAATAQFYSALNTMFTGDIQPMKGVWSHASDVTYMGPAGDFQVGWKKVLESWESQAAMKLGGTVKPKSMSITVAGDMAVVSDIETGHNKGKDGKVEVVSIRATNVFRKENGVWKMIGHHTDILPHLAK